MTVWHPAIWRLPSLVERVRQGGVQEVILALSSTMEGDTDQLLHLPQAAGIKELKISVLSRWHVVGRQVQYTDEITLGRSIVNRIPFSVGL
jgi:recombination protein RecR